jgi:hypothetical protein
MTSIASPTVADNAPEVVHLNDRGEAPYDGTHDIGCANRFCEQFGRSHSLEWHESLSHTAFKAEGLIWYVEVSWYADQSAWAVYGECETSAGPLEEAETTAFETALAQAYSMTRDMNQPSVTSGEITAGQ